MEKSEKKEATNKVKNNWVYTLLYPFIWLYMVILHPWKAVGRENIPEGGVLICGNHTKMIDPLYVVCAIGRKPQIRIMAKAELMRVPVIGFLLKKAGIFGVERGKSDVGAIKESLRTLKNGQPLLMFPEGRRVRKGETGEAHTGAAMLATRSNVPILPVYIPPEKKWFHRVKVVFGKPYMPTLSGKKVTPEDYQAIADELMEHIFQLEDQAK